MFLVSFGAPKLEKLIAPPSVTHLSDALEKQTRFPGEARDLHVYNFVVEKGIRRSERGVIRNCCFVLFETITPTPRVLSGITSILKSGSLLINPLN